jgi:hypothetical protein
MKADKKLPKPIKRIKLPEVTVTATRIKKPVAQVKPKEQVVRLTPKGEVSKRRVDSLYNAGYGKLIGKGYGRVGEVKKYGADASDIIKKALKIK